MSDDLLERLRTGGFVWPWVWSALARRDDEPLIDALLAGLRHFARLAEPTPDALLATLAAIVQRPLGLLRLAEPARVEALVDGLAAEPTGWLGVRHARLWRFTRYEEILTALGAAAHDPLRRLLDGPPRPVDYLNIGENQTTLLLSRWFGAKLVALACLATAGEPADRQRFERLASDATEPATVRQTAGLLARLAAEPERRRAVLAESVLSVSSDHFTLVGAESYYGQIARIAAAGPVLVEPAVECLVGEDWVLRERVSLILSALGEPAREPVAALREASRDWRVEQAAQAVLYNLDLRRHFTRRRPSDRSLSRARRPVGDDGRGISRAAPDTDDA